MKLLVLSDLHLEFGRPYEVPPGLEYDVAVLAGDISTPGLRVVRWAQRDSTFGGRPVVVVPGNHEFYGRELETELDEMCRVAEGSNVSLLNRGVVEIDRVRFLGCTLWTDFQLAHRSEEAPLRADVSAALAAANRRMMDYERIETRIHPKPGSFERARRRTLRAEDTLARHWIDRDWLRRSLGEPFIGQTVVVTHHAPSMQSVPPRYVGDQLSPAFASDLPSEMFDVPSVWIHGHTHWPVDYRRGSCRVISNPRGYLMKDGSIENSDFRPAFVVDVQRGPA
jgi:predicted phosphodiesterase